MRLEQLHGLPQQTVHVQLATDGSLLTQAVDSAHVGLRGIGALRRRGRRARELGQRRPHVLRSDNRTAQVT